MSTAEAPHRPAPSAEPTIPRGWAALIGVLGVAAAPAAGQLIAGLLSPASSPYLAVGDGVIRLAPHALVEFAKATFGTADKPVLLAGMAVVLAAVAALAGLASRRKAGPGVVVIGVLGVLGLAAVMFAPSFAPLDVLAPTVALVVGIGAFRWLHGLALRAADAPEQPERAGGVSR
ncbi:MAG: molybdopterin-dependent oxidoreductase, partial [Pseudonocardia sp.]